MARHRLRNLVVIDSITGRLIAFKINMLALQFVALWFILRGDSLCYFVLFNIAITSLGEVRANHISVLKVAPRVKLASCKSALNSPGVLFY